MTQGSRPPMLSAAPGKVPCVDPLTTMLPVTGLTAMARTKSPRWVPNWWVQRLVPSDALSSFTYPSQLLLPALSSPGSTPIVSPPTAMLPPSRLAATAHTRSSLLLPNWWVPLVGPERGAIGRAEHHREAVGAAKILLPLENP